MSPLDLIPAPYRLLAIAGLLVASVITGYVKGIEHQQGKDAIAEAAHVRAVETANQAQAAKLRPIATQYAEEHAHDLATQPALEAGLDRYLSRADGLRCAAAGPAGAPVPDVRRGPADQAAAGRADGRGAPAPADDAALTAHIAHDASLYRQCAAQLSALIDTARAAGADTP